MIWKNILGNQQARHTSSSKLTSKYCYIKGPDTDLARLTSLKTKTWFRTHIGSISFKTEHKLVSLCIAASNLEQNRSYDTINLLILIIPAKERKVQANALHFDWIVIFWITFMAWQRITNCSFWGFCWRNWNSGCIIQIKCCLLWKKLRLHKKLGLQNLNHIQVVYQSLEHELNTNLHLQSPKSTFRIKDIN